MYKEESFNVIGWPQNVSRVWTVSTGRKREFCISCLLVLWICGYNAAQPEVSAVNISQGSMLETPCGLCTRRIHTGSRWGVGRRTIFKVSLEDFVEF